MGVYSKYCFEVKVDCGSYVIHEFLSIIWLFTYLIMKLGSQVSLTNS